MQCGFYTGNLKQYIYLYSKVGKDIVMPIGCLSDIWDMHPILTDYEVDFGKHEKVEYPELSFNPYDYQEKAIQGMIQAKRGILKASCGSGKSICAVNIIKRIGYRALIITQTMEILNQFKEYCINVMNLSPDEIGVIANGKVNIGSKITLSLKQTLCKIDITPYKEYWGTIIIDECQNVSSNPSHITQYEKILNNIVAPYRIALSATPKRQDGLTNAMIALCGKVVYEITPEEVKDKTIKAKIQPIYTSYKIERESLKCDGTINYTTLPTNIAINDSRNNLILDLLKQEKDNYCLVLSDRLDGLEILHKKIGGVFINGKMTSKKAKEERKDAIDRMRNKEEHILLASYSLAREGLDIKNLNRLFLIAPTKNSNVLIQSVRSN